MSRMLAMLSGKGGSGKTTLALSMSSLLADCGINVLLVDCDLSTNGATYFYEKNLTQEIEKIISLNSILLDVVNNDCYELLIKDNFHFIPSITSITEMEETYSIGQDGRIESVIEFFNKARERYDIILFDCQAGYTFLLDSILRLTDINLVVMEADAISSASIRSLYLKTSNMLDKKKVFQIFNKVTKEEDQVYSRVSGGTFFTNIGTMSFDWKVRKAFAMAIVPDIENTSYNYGNKVYELCKILFPEREYENNLSEYKNKLDYLNNIEKKKILQEQIFDFEVLKKDKSTEKTRKLMSMMLPLAASAMIVAILSLDNSINNILDTNLITTLLITCLAVSASILLMLEITNDQRERRHKRDIMLKQLDELDEMIINSKEVINSKSKKNRYE